jgi:hypothetical protein
VLVAGQWAGATPASAVSGLVKAPTAASATNSVSPKTETTVCPAGKRVVGGGGWAFTTNVADSNRVMLTRLEPVHIASGDSYVVTGAETDPGIAGTWWLEAYAICAYPLPGLHIVPATTVSSSSPMQATAAVCPGGERVLGTGGKIANAGGQVGLQVARASGSGDIARVQAHEDANGYAGIWNVTGYAICVPPPPGYQVVYGASPQTASESTKVAFAVCPSGKRVHGAGAAISNTAPGGVTLQVVYPFNDLTQVEAVAVENTPASQNWDYIVAQAICAF